VADLALHRGHPAAEVLALADQRAVLALPGLTSRGFS
jgi:hypothetical protein